VWKEGPYEDRKKFMKTLCKKAGVKYFRFHALRHSGTSIMDNDNVPMGAIQEILGHENRTTTEIYLHSLSGTAQKAMATYEQAKRNSHSKEKGVADCTQQLPT
jgi:integrase